ncbi:hypothetical protein E4U12_008173 [Claviceps purpurea]|nr:hypothetical protein E4U12_008173 [Claviceps purpurea]
MDDSESRTTKRSRFDQTEPEPKRPSRFDRRSRSPPTRRSETRERSPLAAGDEVEAKKSPVDAAAAAAAAAARINAAMQARKGIQHSDSQPMKSSASPGGSSGEVKTHSLNKEMYVADGDYMQDIEVNDLRNRYLLTKGSTQKMIIEETGADITTRGSYLPNKAMATAANPPLYLHITSTTKEGLDAAVAKINELIQQELPQLVDERRFRRRDQEQPEPEKERVDRDREHGGRRKWPEVRIPIDLEPVPGFNLRAQIVGHGGSYVKHIQQETGCRVQIKGRGSGYLEGGTNRESDEDMFLHVAGPDPDMVDKAKELCDDLIGNVKEQYEEFKSRPPRFSDRGGHHGGGDRYRGGHDRHYDRGNPRQSHSSYGGYGSDQRAAPASNSPVPSADSTAQNPADYQAAYAQYYGGTDPYAAYGGYANYVAMYQHYYAQAQGTGVPGQPGAPTSASPPPPPPSEAAPPPPPPPSSAAPPPPPPSASPPGGSYSAVPPPPGLLSRPTLVPQYPTAATATPPTPQTIPSSLPASLAYQTPHASNPDPFLLSPILNLPASFGSAYVGETFSCTLCANNDLPPPSASPSNSPSLSTTAATSPTKSIRHVRIEAEMKTPSLVGAAHKLSLGCPPTEGVDLAPGETLQRLVNFDLKEEGNHVLSVTVSYYEATETSGRTRTFRKLYQFMCKASLIVRTKVGALGGVVAAEGEGEGEGASKRSSSSDSSSRRRRRRSSGGGGRGRKWILEAQLENSSDETMQLDRVDMEVREGLVCRDCNWGVREGGLGGPATVQKPILHPGEVEQVCFVLSLDEERPAEAVDGRIMFGVLGIAWRGGMGSRGFITTGQLGTRVV